MSDFVQLFGAVSRQKPNGLAGRVSSCFHPLPNARHESHAPSLQLLKAQRKINLKERKIERKMASKKSTPKFDPKLYAKRLGALYGDWKVRLPITASLMDLFTVVGFS
jgi:hypothetical protein